LGRDEIKTHWLLSIGVLDRDKEWAAANVGEDTFVKLTDQPDEKLLSDLDALKALHRKVTGS
jgi:hypothetical protein